MSTLLKLKENGIIEFSSSDDIDLEEKSYTFYAGFDPTADSLHVGHLFVLVSMARLQKMGHQPIAVLGGATGMIGDPSGKSKERVLLTEDIIQHNVSCIEKQIGLFLNFDAGAKVVNNMDWFREYRFINFLRDIGKLFRVTEMMNKESVQKRLSSDEGISFTEFSYQILQSYDFLKLFEEYGCNMQIGGSDQWGNISAGITLIRKEAGAQAYGLTVPLIKSSSGEKFGKSEGQNIWLDPHKTSPYNFYQFWIQTADADVIQYLHFFTFLEEDQILEYKKSLEENPGAREAQKSLAFEVTKMLHGETEAHKAVQASNVLFGGSLDGIDDQTLMQIFANVPSLTFTQSQLGQGVGLLDVLVEAKLSDSKGKARKLVRQGGVYLNNKRVDSEEMSLGSNNLVGDSTMLLRSGKKKYCLLRFE
tara:strand:- start:1646 stop:2902 length:1257 start_codon:yes stop_codon:yes gene_type:complete